MFVLELKKDIFFRVVMIGVMMFCALLPHATSSSFRNNEIDQAIDSETTVENTSSENSQFTKKELRVITSLLEGKSNRQIASELGVCTRTIEYHLSRIYERLGIGSRAEAIIKLIRLFQK